MTDDTGNTKATYGYTAYGSNDESDFTGIDKPDSNDPTKETYNPYRYNAKRWDAQSSTYDMGFRDYNPGLNRFTTRDMYNGALADMSLGTDPYTGNRYAFTGGNPTTYSELDGHRLACGGEGGETAACPEGHNLSISGATVQDTPPKAPPIKAAVIVPPGWAGLRQAEKWALPRILSLFKTSSIQYNWRKVFKKPEGLTDSQWDTVVDNCQESYGLRETQCRDLPVFVVDGKRTPKIAINDKSAIDVGHPFLLTAMRNKQDAARNRELAGCGKSVWMGPQSCDEYPFASTFEGGVGAQTMGVPLSEQRTQFNDLGSFMATNKMKRGDQFLVAVINVRQEHGIYIPG
ncbi:NucA/NucB deoxyribonuclease domain-containing protein [Streptomyces cellulosae]